MAYKRPLSKLQSVIISLLWGLFALWFLSSVGLSLMMIIVLLASGFIVFYPIYKSSRERKKTKKTKRIRNKRHLLLLLPILCCANLSAQQKEVDKGLDISGYIQAQTEWGGRDASLRVGSLSKSKSNETIKNTWGIRRGRIKFDYKMTLSQAVLQIDLTERGIKLKDAYFRLLSPRQILGQSSLQFGVFDRPFGYEIRYSSARRETPERATIFPLLFPEERDLGLMLSLQAKSTSAWSRLKFDLGLFSGNGINPEVDSRRDFIGRLTFSDSIGRSLDWAVGASYYDGSVYNSLSESFSQRKYYGLDAQIKLKSSWGDTELRAECLWGKQPSTQEIFRSPNGDKLPEGYTLVRPFFGGYVLLLQKLKSLPLSMVLKYDYLDRNTEYSGRDSVVNSSSDLHSSTWGVGLLWDFNPNLRLQTYYEIPHNEIALGVKGYEKDRQDNKFTLRLQYKF